MAIAFMPIAIAKLFFSRFQLSATLPVKKQMIGAIEYIPYIEVVDNAGKFVIATG